MPSNAGTIPAQISLFLKARGDSHRIRDNGLPSSPKYSRGNDIFDQYFKGPQNVEDLVHRAVCNSDGQKFHQMLYSRIGSSVDSKKGMENDEDLID